MPTLPNLKIKIFADGADPATIAKLRKNPAVKGFTTNPTLMRKAGASDYEKHCRAVLEAAEGASVSLEVFADDPVAIETQARIIAGWGPNVAVKVPVSTTKGEFLGPTIAKLAKSGIALNVTALTTLAQVERVRDALEADVPAIVSVFAGRIADTGRDPMPIMSDAAKALTSRPKAELLWASPREVLNLYQAEAVGCHIITMGADLLSKLDLYGKDLDAYSIETVKMFHSDAVAAGFVLGAGR
ncbi:MAG: transaldolase [Magnetospirillum sp.]|nr:transaldolase [Magnetospirillum sp.]